MEAKFIRGNPLFARYKPAGAIAAGEVVVVGDLACIAHSAIAASAWGNLAVGGGIYEAVANEAIAVGKRVFWSAGNKLTETTTDTLIGFLALHLAASAQDDVVQFIHNPHIDLIV